MIIYSNDLDYERCWETGEWDGQFCVMCPYNGECSGSEIDEEDE